MSNLDQRYPTRRAPRRGWWIAGIALVTVAALAWMVSVTFGSSSIETRDITHSVDPATGDTSITWSVSVAAGTEVSCALQALNQEFQVVGWKVVDLPASADYTREFTETLRTAMPPTSGLAYSCWAS